MRLPFLIFILVTLSTPSLADKYTQSVVNRVNQVSANVSVTMDNLDLLWQRASDKLIGFTNYDDLLLQETLKALTNDKFSRSIRAFLVINAEGELVVDSTRYPATKINLSDRDYVKNAPLGDAYYIGGMLKGRQSGMPFIPMSRTFSKPSGAGKAVMAMIVSPNVFSDYIVQCKNCVTTIMTKKGNVVLTLPRDTDISADFISSIPLNLRQGVVDNQIGVYKTRTAFKALEKFPLVVVTSEPIEGFEPSSDASINW